MLYLGLLRHAKSDWSDPSLADIDRPLSKRGRKNAKNFIFKNLKIHWDIILSSDSVRTRQTLELHEPQGQIDFSNELYHASASAILRYTRAKAAGSHTLIVGHNPGLNDFLDRLINLEHTKAHVDFPTGAFALLQVQVKSWDKLNFKSKCRLIRLDYPKQGRIIPSDKPSDKMV